jgi:hypothetical protein
MHELGWSASNNLCRVAEKIAHIFIRHIANEILSGMGLLGREIAFFCRTLDSVSCHLRLLEPWLSLDYFVRSYVGSQKLR